MAKVDNCYTKEEKPTSYRSVSTLSFLPSSPDVDGPKKLDSGSSINSSFTPSPVSVWPRIQVQTTSNPSQASSNSCINSAFTMSFPLGVFQPFSFHRVTHSVWDKYTYRLSVMISPLALAVLTAGI